MTDKSERRRIAREERLRNLGFEDVTPDGARRLELLEELASRVTRWFSGLHSMRASELTEIVDAIDLDNERVSRLKNKT